MVLEASQERVSETKNKEGDHICMIMPKSHHNKKKKIKRQKRKVILSMRGTQGYNAIPEKIMEQSCLKVERKEAQVPKVDTRWSSNKTGSGKEGKNQDSGSKGIQVRLPVNNTRS